MGVGHGTHRYQMFEDKQERLYRDAYRSACLGCLATPLERCAVYLPTVQ
jgi:hypothetical protein